MVYYTNGTWQIYGVASGFSVDRTNHLCDWTAPSLFTMVPKYLNWIIYNTQKSWLQTNNALNYLVLGFKLKKLIFNLIYRYFLIRKNKIKKQTIWFLMMSFLFFFNLHKTKWDIIIRDLEITNKTKQKISLTKKYLN